MEADLNIFWLTIIHFAELFTTHIKTENFSVM